MAATLPPASTPGSTPARVTATPPLAPARVPAALDVAAPAPARSSRGLWKDAWRRLRRNRLAMASLVFVCLLALVAVFADVLSPYDPTYLYPASSYGKPSAAHPLGFDDVGRDNLSRLIHGARVSLSVGVFVQLIILSIAALVGGAAGYFGGRIDNWLMRFTDIVYAFPDLLFLIIIMSALGAGIFNIFFAIGIVAWTDLARLIRGQLLSLRERDFVLAARALGASGPRITLSHLLPNALGPVIVSITFGIPRAIFAEAALSFIGLGVRPPQASWGTMIERGNQAILVAPHVVLFPGIAIALTMLAFSFLGDGLRDALDPQAHR